MFKLAEQTEGRQEALDLGTRQIMQALADSASRKISWGVLFQKKDHVITRHLGL
jgi:hypothetical protein